MDYFHAPPDKHRGSTIVIDGDEYSHLIHVMRKKVGDEIMTVDGCGNAYRVTISEIDHHTAVCAIAEHHPGLHEPSLTVTLGVGILKHTAAVDFLVEKTTELGVSRIVPLQTARTIPRHGREERWQKIALSAMKQSGRCLLPYVTPLTSFSEFLQAIPRNAEKCIPHEKILTPTLPEVMAASTAKEVVLAIGPEGGFTEEEIAAAVLAGFEVVSLGVRRLRTDTAAIAAVWAVAGR